MGCRLMDVCALLLMLMIGHVSRIAGQLRNAVDGYALSGRVCLNQCRGECVTELTTSLALRVEPCINVGSMQYFTAQYRSAAPLCAGPCGRFGMSFDWCFVNSTSWDYCSAQTITELVDDCPEPCHVELREDGLPSRLCRTANSWTQCQRYIRAHTPYGGVCLDRCAPSGGFLMSCLTNMSLSHPPSMIRQPCALPARIYLHVDETTTFSERTDFGEKANKNGRFTKVFTSKFRLPPGGIAEVEDRIKQIQSMIDDNTMSADKGR